MDAEELICLCLRAGEPIQFAREFMQDFTMLEWRTEELNDAEMAIRGR